MVFGRIATLAKKIGASPVVQKIADHPITKAIFPASRAISLVNTSVKLTQGAATPGQVLVSAALTISDVFLTPGLSTTVHCIAYLATCTLAVVAPGPTTIGGCFMYTVELLK